MSFSACEAGKGVSDGCRRVFESAREYACVCVCVLGSTVIRPAQKRLLKQATD